jgi:redox-sensitive bicupin YhaK (pirin superfamily)
VVRRALPTRQQRMVGAWCFLDHAGPVAFAPGPGCMGAHPHIGLQTFTWLIEGEVMHHDSLGNAQLIRPGQVNLMTAGRGIVHTEDSLHDGARLHAAQLWIALPPGRVDCPPAFEHHPTLPRWQEGDTRLTLLAGRHGVTAPTRVHSPLLGLDLESAGASRLTLTLEPGFEYGRCRWWGRWASRARCFRPTSLPTSARGGARCRSSSRRPGRCCWAASPLPSRC